MFYLNLYCSLLNIKNGNYDIATKYKNDAKNIIIYKVKPLLKEYWYDDPAKVNEWNRNLDNAVK